MAELKTKVSDDSIEDFLNKIPDEQKRQDCYTLVGIMKEVTQAEPKMWGDAIIGFGSYRYKGKSSEGDWFLLGFSPRKQSISLYFMPGHTKDPVMLEKLGKYKIEGSCLHIKKLSEVDTQVLVDLLRKAIPNR
jgi:hypothetical protein